MSGTNKCPSLQELEGIICESQVVLLRNEKPVLSHGGIYAGNPEGDKHERCADARPLRPDGSGAYILDPKVLDAFCRAAYEACPLLKKTEQQ